MTEAIVVIRPVLIRPGGIAREEDAAAVRAAIASVQGWFDRRGVRVLVADPRQPYCPESLAWFQNYPGGAFFGIQAWCVFRGHVRDGEKVLAIMAGYKEGHGEAGLSVAAVGYGVVADLRGDEAQVNDALWILAHEIAHLMGYRHVADPGDLMSEISSRDYFPAVALSLQGNT